MADFVYSTGSTYNGGNGRFGARYTTAQNSAYSDGKYWTQPAAAYDSRPPEVLHRDHVCRPVAVDAYGRPIPGVVVLPADQHVGKAEYVAEHVYSTRIQPYHDHAASDPLDCDNGKCKPLFSPTREQGLRPNKVNEFIAGVQTDVSSGPRSGGFPSGMFQRRAATAGPGRGWQFGREEAPLPARPYEQNTITRPSRDVGALAEYVQEAARPKLVGRLTAAPARETIDHNEAQRRYNSVPATGTIRDVDPSLPTIDHKTAALKYSGALVN